MEAHINTSERQVVGKPFPKGVSGNPGGRPKAMKKLVELARVYTEEAILTLAECLQDKDGRVRVAAANALLDRGWGKPVQPTEEQPDHEALSELSDEELKKLVLES